MEASTPAFATLSPLTCRVAAHERGRISGATPRRKRIHEGGGPQSKAARLFIGRHRPKILEHVVEMPRVLLQTAFSNKTLPDFQLLR